MSDETKRDVFCAMAVENSIGQQSMWYRRYNAALPDETDEQKACIYCHNKHFQKISQESY